MMTTHTVIIYHIQISGSTKKLYLIGCLYLNHQRRTMRNDDYFEIIKDGDHKTEHLIVTLECPKCGCRVEANSKSKKLKRDDEDCRITYSCECPCCGYTMFDIDRKSVRI